MKKQYFCNPLNMDYRYQFIQDMRSGEDKISREAADPSMILFQGKYYIFASMTLSVWVSEDMVHWESHRLPDSLPLFALPEIPASLETLRIIALPALAIAMVGLLESVLTAAVVDDLTGTPSNKSCECTGLGLANVSASPSSNCS